LSGCALEGVPEDKAVKVRLMLSPSKEIFDGPEKTDVLTKVRWNSGQNQIAESKA